MIDRAFGLEACRDHRVGFDVLKVALENKEQLVCTLTIVER